MQIPFSERSCRAPARRCTNSRSGRRWALPPTTENGERLASFAKVVELVAREPGRDALSPMRRENGRPRHADGREAHPPGIVRENWYAAATPTNSPFVDGDVDPVGGHGLACPLDVALLDLFAERHIDRPEGLDELVFVGRLAEFDRHYAIFSSGA